MSRAVDAGHRPDPWSDRRVPRVCFETSSSDRATRDLTLPNGLVRHDPVPLHDRALPNRMRSLADALLVEDASGPVRGSPVGG